MPRRRSSEITVRTEEQMRRINRLVGVRCGELGISFSELAKRAGISSRNLRNIRALGVVPNLTTLVGLSVALELPLEKLVAGLGLVDAAGALRLLPYLEKDDDGVTGNP